MTILPSEPPNVVKKFWHSRFGRAAERALTPSKWWNILFGFVVIVVVVWTLTIYRSQAKDEAVHAAEIVANADGQYNQCVASIPAFTKINGFITGDRIIRNTLVKNSYAIYIATPKTSMQYIIRRSNWQHLRKARAAAYQVKFPVPTKKQCADRRAEVFIQAHEKVPPLQKTSPTPTPKAPSKKR